MREQVFSDLLEAQLTQRLRPIQPRPEFVFQLQNQLTRPKVMQIEEQNYGLALITVSIGLFLGVLTLWFLRRIS